MLTKDDKLIYEGYQLISENRGWLRTGMERDWCIVDEHQEVTSDEFNDLFTTDVSRGPGIPVRTPKPGVLKITDDVYFDARELGRGWDLYYKNIPPYNILDVTGDEFNELLERAAMAFAQDDASWNILVNTSRAAADDRELNPVYELLSSIRYCFTGRAKSILIDKFKKQYPKAAEFAN